MLRGEKCQREKSVTGRKVPREEVLRGEKCYEENSVEGRKGGKVPPMAKTTRREKTY